MIKVNDENRNYSDFYGRIKQLKQDGNSAYMVVARDDSNESFIIHITHLKYPKPDDQNPKFYILVCDGNLILNTTPIKIIKRVTLEIRCPQPYNPDMPLNPSRIADAQVYILF